MTANNPHEAYFRDVLQNLYSGNFEPFSDAVSDDYVCHTPGRSLLAGDHRGKDQMDVKRPKLRKLCEGTFRVRAAGDIIIGAEYGMVPVIVTAEAAGRKLETRAFGIWRFRDDKIVEHWEMNYDQYGFDEFMTAAAAAAGVN